MQDENETFRMIREPVIACMNACDALEEALRESGCDVAADLVFQESVHMIDAVSALATPERHRERQQHGA